MMGFTMKNRGISKFVATLSAVLLSVVGFVGQAQPASAALSTVCNGTGGTPTVSFLSDTIFTIDTAPGYDANYIGYSITPSAAGTDIWVKLDNFTGGVVSLAPSQPVKQQTGPVTSGSPVYTYFLAKATGTTATDQSHRMAVYEGDPDLGGTAICSVTKTFTDVEDTIEANANKVDTVTVSSTVGLTLGSSVTVTAAGTTGTLGAGPSYDPGVINLSPAPKSTFPAGAWRLTNVQLIFNPGAAGQVIHNNVLHLANQSSADRAYQAIYTFKAVGSTSAATVLSPIQYIASGTQIKETGSLPTGASLAPLPVVTNQLTASKSSNVHQLSSGGGTVVYTVTVSNAATSSTYIDQVVDTLPTGATYVAGTSLINGTASADPTVVTGTPTKIVYRGPFTIPGSGSRTFTYSLTIPGTDGTYTNSAVAYIGSTLIDRTLSTSDNQPATAAVAVGTPPPAVDPQTLYTAKATPANFTASITSVVATTTPCMIDPADSVCKTSVTIANVGTWTLSGNNPIFTPASNFVGTSTVTYQISNTAGPSSGALMTAIVLAPPTLANSTGTVAIGGTVYATPPATAAAGTTIDYTSAEIYDPATSQWVTSFDTTDGRYSVDPVSGRLSFVANSSATPGVKTPIQYRIKDALGQYSLPATATITVTAPAPTITSESASTTETTPVTLTPTITGTGVTGCLVNGATCTSSVTIPGEGTYVLNQNGSVTFTAQSGFTGVSSVDYRITDGVYTRTGTMTVTVNAIPVVNLYTISMDTLDSNAVTGVTQGSAGASVALTQGLTRNGYTFGGWSLTSGGTTPISYTQTPTANITVYAIWTPVVVPPVTNPAPPTVGPASATTTGTTPVNLTPPVTYNGGTPSRCLVDPADNVCKQSVTLPGKGTFVLNANGSVTFTAVTGFVGTAVVQYRVTDVYGQSTESPVTVTVVAPPAPVPGPASGTTLTRTPITLTPALVNGPATLCLVDPADNVCKQSVTFPGKGTFVLNSDGTVKFTPAPGFIGELTVQLRATDEYGHSNEAPITVIVTDAPGGQNGAGNGKTPVVLTPLTVIPVDAEICLVDPKDGTCKQVVVLPKVGTWKVTANRNVVFIAAPGYVGTNTVDLRITRASVSTRAPYTVTIAKKRPPVTITIGGFNPGSPVLTKAIKAKIKAFLAAYTDYRTIECIGFTMGPTVLAVDDWLSMTRATNACGFVKKNLKSKLVQLPLKNKQETVLGAQIRRITITLRD